jgi:hypothetical protein
MDYKKKYLKYKNKYLEKKLIGGSTISVYDKLTTQIIFYIDSEDTNEETIRSKIKDKIDNGLEYHYIFYDIEIIEEQYYIVDTYDLIEKDKDNNITSILRLKEEYLLYKSREIKPKYKELFEFIDKLNYSILYNQYIKKLFDNKIDENIKPLYNFIYYYSIKNNICNYRTNNFIEIYILKLYYRLKIQLVDNIKLYKYSAHIGSRIGNILFSIMRNIIYVKTKQLETDKYIFICLDDFKYLRYESNKELFNYLTLYDTNKLIYIDLFTDIPIPFDYNTEYIGEYYPYKIINLILLNKNIRNSIKEIFNKLYIDLRKEEQKIDDESYITITIHYRLSDFCANGYNKCFNKRLVGYEGDNYRILSFIYYCNCLEKIFNKNKEEEKKFKIIIYYYSNNLDDLFIKLFIEYLNIYFENIKEKIQFITEIQYLNELTDKSKIFDLSIIYTASLSKYLILSNSTFGFWMFYFRLLRLENDSDIINIDDVLFGKYLLYTKTSELFEFINNQLFLSLDTELIPEIIDQEYEKYKDYYKDIIKADIIKADIKIYNSKITFDKECIVNSSYFYCIKNDIIRMFLVYYYIYKYITDNDKLNELIELLKCSIDYNIIYCFEFFKKNILKHDKNILKDIIKNIFTNFSTDNKNIAEFLNKLKDIDNINLLDFILSCSYIITDKKSFEKFIEYNSIDYEIDMFYDNIYINFISKFLKKDNLKLLNDMMTILTSSYMKLKQFDMYEAKYELFINMYNIVNKNIDELYSYLHTLLNNEFILFITNIYFLNPSVDDIIRLYNEIYIKNKLKIINDLGVSGITNIMTLLKTPILLFENPKEFFSSFLNIYNIYLGHKDDISIKKLSYDFTIIKK